MVGQWAIRRSLSSVWVAAEDTRVVLGDRHRHVGVLAREARPYAVSQQVPRTEQLASDRILVGHPIRKLRRKASSNAVGEQGTVRLAMWREVARVDSIYESRLKALSSATTWCATCACQATSLGFAKGPRMSGASPDASRSGEAPRFLVGRGLEPRGHGQVGTCACPGSAPATIHPKRLDMCARAGGPGPG